MTALPPLKGDRVVRALEKAGFEVVRIKGSHPILRHRSDPACGTVVPVQIKRGLLRRIVSDGVLTIEESRALL
jgi:predicted RNA binding protein YcfA (HicA-like mRNA interferase family)